MTDEPIRVVRNDTDRRYEAHLAGELAGFVTYDEQPGHVTLVHTEVDSRFKHRGVASQLIGATLDDLRARRVTVTPRCPFVADFIRHHPEYTDLVASDATG